MIKKYVKSIFLVKFSLQILNRTPSTLDPEELRLIEEVTAVADVAEVVDVSIGVDLVSMDRAPLKYLFFLRLSSEVPEFLVLS